MKNLSKIDKVLVVITIIIALILFSAVLTSCESRFIRAEIVTDGQVVLVRDNHNFTNIGDTIVIRHSKRGHDFYGFYKGTIPKSHTTTRKFPEGGSMYINYDYKTAIRIK